MIPEDAEGGDMAVLGKLLSTKPGHAVNQYLSRKVGGTNIGYHFHLIGQLKIKNAQRFYKNAVNDSFSQTTLNFRKVGYAAKPTPYPDALIQAIRTKLMALMEDKNNYINQMSSGYQGKEDIRRVLKDPMKCLPELRNLIDQPVIDQIESYFGSYFDIQSVEVWRNYHVPAAEKGGAEVYSDFWHFDQRTIDFVKLFVNLSDVTEDDGPFHIQSRQRSRELLRKGFKNRKDYGLPLEEMDHPSHVVKAVGPAGTGLYCNTEVCLHRADIPKKGHFRDIIQFRFIPAHKPLAADWFNNPAINHLDT